MEHIRLSLDTSYSEQEQVRIRGELDRILTSERFVNANRISSMLRYVVEEALAGRGDRIKAFSVAQDVFGRDVSFDPQRDPIVRVEAGRLRKLLTDYYESLGGKSDVQIDVPKGGYAPTFSLQSGSSVRASHSRSTRLTIVSLLCLAVAVAWIWFHQPKEQLTTEGPDSTTFLAVLPLSYRAQDLRAADTAENFVDSTITMLARLPGLSVMAHTSMMEFDQEKISVNQLREDYGVTHALRGSIQTLDDVMRMRVQLIDTTSSEIIWSDSLEGNIQDVWELQDQMTAQLLDAFSIELSTFDKQNLLTRYTESIEALALYRQGLIMILPPADDKRVKAAKYVFDRVKEIDPNFAGGYAGAAWTYALPVLFQNTSAKSEDLARAIDLARKSIQVDPSFGAGYAVLGFTQALMGFKVEALENVRFAAAIQPGDAFVHFLRAVTLVLVGVPEEAFKALDDAMRLNPIEKRTPYLNVYGIARFVNGEYQLSTDLIEKNRKAGGPIGPHMDIFSAAAYAHLGKNDQASALIKDIYAAAPDFPYAAWLENWLGKGQQLDTTLAKLRNSGLQTLDEY